MRLVRLALLVWCVVGKDGTWGDGIPRTVVQMMVGPGANAPIPERVEEAWLQLDPGVQYVFFNDSRARAFLSEHYSEQHMELYHALSPNKYKSDLFRLCYLEHKGGVYADVDHHPLIPLGDLIKPSTDLLVVWNGGQDMCNGFIAAAPGHPVVHQAIERMLAVGTGFLAGNGTDPPHPTRQLYELFRDRQEPNAVAPGQYGATQLADERCDPSPCAMYWEDRRFAFTRYDDWGGDGFSWQHRWLVRLKRRVWGAVGLGGVAFLLCVWSGWASAHRSAAVRSIKHTDPHQPYNIFLTEAR